MIKVYYAIATENVEEVAQLTSCGILLVLEYGSYNRYRLLGYGLGASSVELANIQAIRLALAAINPAFWKVAILLHVASIVIELLAQKDPQPAVTELLRLCDRFEDCGFIIETSDNENTLICLSLAKKICASQQTYDSHTLDHLPNEI